MNDIQVAGMYVVTRLTDYYVDLDRAERIRSVLDSTSYIDIDGDTVLVSQIQGIISPSSYKDLMIKRGGGWYCTPCNRWLDRNTKCGFHQR